MKPLRELLKAVNVDADHIPDTMMVIGPAKLSDATDVHLGFLANMKYEAELYTTKAAAILVPREFSPRNAVSNLLIPVDDPYETITKILELFADRKVETGIKEPVSLGENISLGKDVYIGEFTTIKEGASLGKNCRVYPQVYIGENVTIGKNTIIYSGVKIYHDCIIGEGCIIHSGTIIGSDGFGFTPNQEGEMKKIPQIGNVIIKNNVEIGSNCTIDRATMGSTIVGVGVKLDNLIMVGHNVVIGNHTVIAAQSGVSGSTKIGKHTLIGGQVGLAGHLTIAPNTQINAKSGIAKSVLKSGTKINGIPAFNFMDSLRSHSVYRRLPDLEKKIKEIEEILSLLRK